MLNWFSVETQLKMFKQGKLNAIDPDPVYPSALFRMSERSPVHIPDFSTFHITDHSSFR
jgi:hypothetical protein